MCSVWLLKGTSMLYRIVTVSSKSTQNHLVCRRNIEETAEIYHKMINLLLPSTTATTKEFSKLVCTFWQGSSSSTKAAHMFHLCYHCFDVAWHAKKSLFWLAQNCWRCGHGLWHCREIKNHERFSGTFMGIHENLYLLYASQKFLIIRYF